MTDPIMSIARGLMDPTTTLFLIGPEEEKFSAHKMLLCERVEYFRCAYNSQMQEAQENLFRFSDINSTDFRSLLLWLYTSELFLNPPDSQPLQIYPSSRTRHDEGDSDNSSFESDSDIDDEEEVTDSEQEAEEDSDDYIFEPTREQSRVYEVIQIYKDSADLTVDELDMLVRYYDDFSGTWTDDEQALMSNWEQALSEKKEAAQKAELAEAVNISRLIGLYILADRFGVHELRVKIINHLQDELDRRACLRDNHSLEKLPSFGDVARAFDNLPTRSPLRAWLTYVFAYEWNPESDSPEQTAQREPIPKDFWMDVAIISIIRSNGTHDGKALYERDLCYFHEHKSWEEVKACRVARGKNPDSGIIEADDFDEASD